MVEGLLPGQIRPVATGQQAGPAARRQELPDVSFRQSLDESLRSEGGVKFSAHALKRISSRGIELGNREMSEIEDAVRRAASKGSRDSLLMAEDYALVVNIPSRTVITAMDRGAMREGVITNVDSAVFLQGTR
ncbi:flagellar biosynthesis protein [bacterium]|nr:flagellar biosynthesis protein [bacterium]